MSRLRLTPKLRPTSNSRLLRRYPHPVLISGTILPTAVDLSLAVQTATTVCHTTQYLKCNTRTILRTDIPLITRTRTAVGLDTPNTVVQQGISSLSSTAKSRDSTFRVMAQVRLTHAKTPGHQVQTRSKASTPLRPGSPLHRLHNGRRMLRSMERHQTLRQSLRRYSSLLVGHGYPNRADKSTIRV